MTVSNPLQRIASLQKDALNLAHPFHHADVALSIVRLDIVISR